MNQRIAFLIISLLGCIWGTSYILIVQGLKVFTAVQVGGMRIVFATIALLPWVYKYGFSNSKISFTFKDHLYFFISGLVGFGLPAYMFSYAGKHIPSALSGILTALTPVFTLLISVFFFADKVKMRGILGIAAGFIGIFIIFIPSLAKVSSIPLFPAALALIATLMYGVNINLIKHRLAHIPALAKTAFPFLYMGIPYVLVLLYSGIGNTYSSQLPQASSSLFFVLLLGVVGSALSMVLFNKVIQHVSPVVASTNTFVIPIVAVAWGIYFGEALAWNHFAGLAAIILSLVLLLHRSNK